MYTYSRKVRAEGKTFVWRNVDVDDRSKAYLALVIRLPEDGDPINLFIEGLSPNLHQARDVGLMQPGEVVTVDLYDMVAVYVTAARDTAIECMVLASSAPRP